MRRVVMVYDVVVVLLVMGGVVHRT